MRLQWSGMAFQVEMAVFSLRRLAGKLLDGRVLRGEVGGITYHLLVEGRAGVEREL